MSLRSAARRGWGGEMWRWWWVVMGGGWWVVEAVAVAVVDWWCRDSWTILFRGPLRAKA